MGDSSDDDQGLYAASELQSKYHQLRQVANPENQSPATRLVSKEIETVKKQKKLKRAQSAKVRSPATHAKSKHPQKQ